MNKILTTPSPLAQPAYMENLEYIKDGLQQFEILVIGAGGLGCEILKTLALSGFKTIHVIDLDTIDVTNLNRQFLFRKSDIGKYKAEVAAKFVMERVPSVQVIPYTQKIQELPIQFYQKFPVVIAGLDNIEARRWINKTLVELTKQGLQADGTIDINYMHYLIDGGTEGMNGQARVITPFNSACYECTLNQIPKQVQYQMCTLANNPRLPEHCIAYFYENWPKENGPLDKDNFEHMNWIYQKALKRAKEYKIEGVTYKLTMAVVKNIIPAVASTNAIIASICVAEAFKIATGNGQILNNYLSWIGQAEGSGISVNVLQQERIPDCEVCQINQKFIKIKKDSTVQELLNILQNVDVLSTYSSETLFTKIEQLQVNFEERRFMTFAQLENQGILKPGEKLNLLYNKEYTEIFLQFI